MAENLLGGLAKVVQVLTIKITTEKKGQEFVKLSQENKQINDVVNSIIGILKHETGDSVKKNDYWFSLSEELSGRPSMGYIKYRCGFMQQDEQKLLLWCLLEISQKTIDNALQHISKTNMIENYSETSCLRSYFQEILEEINSLQKLAFKIEGRLPQFYANYLIEKKLPNNGSFSPTVSVDNSILFKQAAEQRIQNKRKSSLNKSLSFQSQNKKKAQEIHNKTISFQDLKDKEIEISSSSLQASQVITSTQTQEQERQREIEKQLLKELGGESFQTSSVIAPSQTQTYSYQAHEIKKQEYQVSSTYAPKTNGYDQEENDTYQLSSAIAPTQTHQTNFDLNTILNSNRFSNGLYSQFVPQGSALANSDSNAHLLIGFTPQAKEEQTKEHNTRVRPSKSLYDEQFANIQESFLPKYKEAATLEQQKNQCHECSAKISKGFYVIGNNANFCYYTGFWYCSTCIAIDKKVIWWKALESFDLTGYKVSVKASKEIDALYKLPILRFEYDSDLVNKNQTLYEFMILKRQIYLLYDVLCSPDYLENQLRGFMNLCVKPNLFSLKNFYDINNGSLAKLLEDTLKLFQQHIEGCDKCIRKGRDCSLCNAGSKLYVFDLKNTAVCDNCKEIYHRVCLLTQDCKKCHYDN